MNPAPGTSAPAGNGGGFDPRQAATLLDQTTRQARRKLQPSPPWLLVTRAVLVLAAVLLLSWVVVAGERPRSLTWLLRVGVLFAGGAWARNTTSAAVTSGPTLKL